MSFDMIAWKTLLWKHGEFDIPSILCLQFSLEFWTLKLLTFLGIVINYNKQKQWNKTIPAVQYKMLTFGFSCHNIDWWVS